MTTPATLPPPLSDTPSVEVLERLLVGLHRPVQRGVPSPPPPDRLLDLTALEAAPMPAAVPMPARVLVQPMPSPVPAVVPPSLSWSAGTAGRTAGRTATALGLAVVAAAGVVAGLVAAGELP